MLSGGGAGLDSRVDEADRIRTAAWDVTLPSYAPQFQRSEDHRDVMMFNALAVGTNCRFYQPARKDGFRMSYWLKFRLVRYYQGGHVKVGVRYVANPQVIIHFIAQVNGLKATSVAQQFHVIAKCVSVRLVAATMGGGTMAARRPAIAAKG